MLHKSFLQVLVVLISSSIFTMSGCSFSGKRSVAEQLGPFTVTEKNSETLALGRADMVEKMRDLQDAVFALEDKVYGNRKLGSLGLYGDLKSCRRRLSSRQYGGNGTLIWSEPLDRLTDKEEDLKIGLDEKGELIGTTEDLLKTRLRRFQTYSAILKKRQEDMEARISSCNTEVAGKEMDGDQPSRVLIQEAPKTSIDRAEVNRFMCDFAKAGASLQSFMLNAFARSWLSISDFNVDQNLLSASLKDVSGKSREHALLFSGWRLAFDRGDITLGQLLNKGADARLVAWAHDNKSAIEENATCLSRADGQWNK